MQGFRRQVFWGMFLMLLPLALMSVLLGLVYDNLQDRHSGDRVTIDGRDEPTSDEYLYVQYSATQLAFISSLSATLALALVPVSLPMLFAYISASSLLSISLEAKDKLPTPYQFELLLRMLQGGTLEIFHYVGYLFKGKHKRTRAVPLVNHAAIMLSSMLLLALGITIVDALFHIKTISVQYIRTDVYASDDFSPGRQLPSLCWNETTDGTTVRSACNVLAGGSGAAPSLTNSTEGYRTLANQSEQSIIRLSDDGQTSVVVPTTFPSGVSYHASSFASSTTCRMATRDCAPHNNAPSSANAARSWAYDCTPESAGLSWNGNFTVESLSGAVTVTYFNTSTRTTNGTTPEGPAVYFAALFAYPAIERNLTLLENIDTGLYYSDATGLVTISDGISFGILSCTTNLYSARYSSSTRGAVSNISTTEMNTTTSAAFIQPLYTVNAGKSSFDNGINIVLANANTSDDISYQFSRLYDRTILSLASGVLETTGPLEATREVNSQVARVPLRDMIALVVLNLCYPLIGLALGIWVLVGVLGANGNNNGVGDVKARLGIGAMVAGNFEHRGYNRDARSVGELFAELRGEKTTRVGVGVGEREKTDGSTVLVGVD